MATMARFRKSRGISSVLRTAIALTTSTWCCSAGAQGPDDFRSKAAALFDEARKLMAQEAYSEACPRLAESQKLDPQVGTTLNLALCYESLGKIASACSTWRDAAAGAAEKLESDRESWAREHVQQVCPRVPMVTIDVAEQPGREDLALTLDDAPVSHAQWGKPMAIDPGAYELRATGKGLESWSSKFIVDERPVPTLLVPALAPLAVAPASVAPAPSPGDGGSKATRAAPSKAAALATGVAGLTAIGVSAAFGVAAIINDQASTHARSCVADNCNTDGARDRLRAMHDADLSDATLAVGAGTLVVSAALWLFAPHAYEHPTGLVVKPTVARGAWSLALGGAWQ
jgi:hypothetical protein